MDTDTDTPEALIEFLNEPPEEQKRSIVLATSASLARRYIDKNRGKLLRPRVITRATSLRGISPSDCDVHLVPAPVEGKYDETEYYKLTRWMKGNSTV